MAVYFASITGDRSILDVEAKIQEEAAAVVSRDDSKFHNDDAKETTDTLAGTSGELT
mgnify:CR=1 FL=1